MKKKNVLLWISLALLLSLSIAPKAINVAEEEAPRPTSINSKFF
ncbi:hypothetical protein [Psychrobacillus sp.]|nr:hypothetical protein [Psychrobacillus sp.]